MKTLVYSTHQPVELEPIAQGYLKVENVQSANLVKKLLEEPRSQYVSENVRQRVLSAVIKNPSLSSQFDLDNLIYILGEPEKTPNYNDYFVEIKIFAPKIIL